MFLKNILSMLFYDIPYIILNYFNDFRLFYPKYNNLK